VVKISVLAGLVSVMLYVSFSQGAADWWTSESSTGSYAPVESVRESSHHLLGSGPFSSGMIVHVLMWGAITLAVLWCLGPSTTVVVRRAVVAIVGSGLMVEVAQEMFTLRNAEIGDVVGNVVGVLLALGAWSQIAGTRIAGSTDSAELLE